MNIYLDSDFQTGVTWRLLWSPGQALKNFRAAVSPIEKRTDTVAQASLQGRATPVCQSLASRLKHVAAGILLVIPLVCTITILALRRFGMITTAKTGAPNTIPRPQTQAKDERMGSSFICPQRFDLVAKILYAELRKKGVSSSWGEEIYAAHIQAWNGFNEDPDLNAREPQKAKTCKQDFIDNFNQILDSIEKDGFDKNRPGIPVGSEDGVALNGAHRLVACYVHGKPVKTFESTIQKRCWNWDYQYWQRERGLDEKYLDAMALKYCEVKKNVYALALFPCARKPDLDEKVKGLVREYGGNIVYSREVALDETGGKNFVVASYYNDHNSAWIGTPNDHFRGAQGLAERKFPHDEGRRPLLMIFFESDLTLDKIVELKAKIRTLYGMEKLSAHITDNCKQSLELAQMVLNPHSIHFLNNRKDGLMARFEDYFKDFKKEIVDRGIDPNDICVDGSAVLAAYGLRDCADLDFLYHGANVPVLGEKFDCHNDHYRHFGLNPDDIIYNPQNHFWYQGIKFASLESLRRLKEKRYARYADPKDSKDLLLIGGVA